MIYEIGLPRRVVTNNEEEMNLLLFNVERAITLSHNSCVDEFSKKLKKEVPQFIESNLQMESCHKLILFGKFCKKIDKIAKEMKL